MEERPKVSVIVPAYNVENYISRCLESILHQTLQDIEIIVVDDGSQDGTNQIVRHYEEQNRCVHLITQENRGVAQARNAGINASSGEWIVFVDADDWIEKELCETVYRVGENEDCEVVAYSAHPFPEEYADKWLKRKLRCRRKQYDHFVPYLLLKESGGAPFIWNKAYSSSLIKRTKVRFEKLRYCEDLVFVFEILPQARKVCFIDEMLYHYRVNREDSLMAEWKTKTEERLQYHVESLGIITKYWYERGFLKRWRVSYLVWYMYFIVPDLLKLRPDNSKQLWMEIIKICDRYNVVSMNIPFISRIKKKIRNAVRQFKKSR